MSEKMHECPACKGAGEFMAHHNTGEDSSGHFWANVECRLCQGEKVVSGTTMQNVMFGKYMRADMQKRGLSLFDVSKIFGLSTAEMSSVLLGRKSLEEAVEEARNLYEQKHSASTQSI